MQQELNPNATYQQIHFNTLVSWIEQLEAALASRGDTPQLHCRECPELMNELRGERDLAYQQALMESQRADALEIQLAAALASRGDGGPQQDDRAYEQLSKQGDWCPTCKRGWENPPVLTAAGWVRSEPRAGDPSSLPPAQEPSV